MSEFNNGLKEDVSIFDIAKKMGDSDELRPLSSPQGKRVSGNNAGVRVNKDIQTRIWSK